MYLVSALHPQVRNIAVSFAKMPDRRKPRSLAIAVIHLAISEVHVGADAPERRPAPSLCFSSFLRRLSPTPGPAVFPADSLDNPARILGTEW
jgi:hypothetical protein